MTGISHEDESQAARALRERCRALGMPLYRCAGAVAKVCDGPAWGEALPWIASAPLREAIHRAGDGGTGPAARSVTELGPGMWRLAVGGRAPAGAGGLAALALGPEALAGERFEWICRAADLAPDAARAALAELARHHRAEAEAWARALRWMYEDLVQVQEHDRTITTFSRQLVDLYEQLNLLYRLGELMSGLDDPHGFVRTACELLHETLAFRWIAVRFSSLPSIGRTLANDLVLEGELPCSHTRYDRLARELAAGLSPGQRPEVIDPARGALAALVGSEVFVNPVLLKEQVAGVMLAGNREGPETAISSVDMQLVSAVADYLSAYLQNAAMYAEQRAVFLGVVKALSASIDAKDRYTRGHSERVALLAAQLARALGMTAEEAERVRLAGTLHDIGKIGVPEAVLLKPGRLTDEEYEAIKRHPTIGHNILKDIEPLHDILPGVLYHHERWDGGGYPEGLRGEQIPRIGRILAVADAFDAMSSDRAYRSRMDRGTVIDEMRRGAGAQWDRDLIGVFLGLDFAKYDAMIERHAIQEPRAA